MSVEVRNITKQFSRFPALKDVSLKVNPGELLALLGPSGSGKTTLLRIIGGLEFPDPGSGQVFLHDQDVTELSARERQIGFVFQHYALFRHLTVFENVAFGMRVQARAKRRSEDAVRQRVKELLALVQLDGLEKRFPGQLSGGQRQRVALARALAVEPKVLLLDEPFGALDAKVRKDLRRWIRHFHKDIHITSIFVTHDQDEALEVADRVVVMNHGRIEQIGTPDEVYDEPANPFVFSFLGRSVTFHGRVEQGRLQVGCSITDLPDSHLAQESAPVIIYVRPQDLWISKAGGSGPFLQAKIRDVNLAGPLIYLELERCDNDEFFQVEVPAELAREIELKEGNIIYVNLKRYRLFAQNQTEEPVQPPAPSAI